MLYEVEYLRRKGGDYKGGDWEDFLASQEDILGRRAADGWELIQVVPLTGMAGFGAAGSSTTAGFLYYFGK